MTPPFLKSDLLSAYGHGFFGRAGGVSEGIYTSLNCGPGSGDDPDAVGENRRRATNAAHGEMLLTAYQTHSAVAAYVDKIPDTPIMADALVTDRPGLAIGALAADCTPVLFADGPLVGAAHAGWRGSLGGILEATIEVMVHHGAELSRLKAAIGPCLRAPLFEVQQDLIDLVTGKYPPADQFFTPSENAQKSIYDHLGFVRWRLTEAGLDPAQIDDVGGGTLSDPERWFSYRASRANNQDDYGRNLSIITAPQG